MTDRFERGGTTLPVVVDYKTGLMWQGMPAPECMNWYDALVYAKSLSQLFHGDWRLPTVQELVSIVDYNQHNPAIDQEFLQTPSNWFWSSSSYATDSSLAWLVSFSYGYVTINVKDHGYRVRCVRAGPQPKGKR